LIPIVHEIGQEVSDPKLFWWKNLDQMVMIGGIVRQSKLEISIEIQNQTLKFKTKFKYNT